MHQQQRASNRDVEQLNNSQIDLLQQPNIVENDLQFINQHDVDMESEKERASSKKARTVAKWRINILMDRKLTFLLQSKIRSTNKQADLHYVHHALIT